MSEPDKRPHDAFRAIAGTPQGRAVLFEILGWTGIHRTVFTGDALGTAFRSGEHNIGQRLSQWLLETAPHAFAQMYKERIDVADGNTNTNANHSGNDGNSSPGSGSDDDYSLIERYPVPGYSDLTPGNGD